MKTVAIVRIRQFSATAHSAPLQLCTMCLERFTSRRKRRIGAMDCSGKDTSLQHFRAQREGFIEESVRNAITSLLAERESLSFYKVAERAQVSRSTLYRKQNLRRMVEGARAGRGVGGNAFSKCDELARENESLRREVLKLRRQLESTQRDVALTAAQKQSPSVRYYVIDLSAAA